MRRSFMPNQYLGHSSPAESIKYENAQRAAANSTTSNTTSSGSSNHMTSTIVVTTISELQADAGGVEFEAAERMRELAAILAKTNEVFPWSEKSPAKKYRAGFAALMAEAARELDGEELQELALFVGEVGMRTRLKVAEEAYP